MPAEVLRLKSFILLAKRQLHPKKLGAETQNGHWPPVIRRPTCRREVLCSFFCTLEERWWNSTAIRPRWANSWLGLDSSANILKELSSLFSWLASSMFSWGRSGITPAADPACKDGNRWDQSQRFLLKWLSMCQDKWNESSWCHFHDT